MNNDIVKETKDRMQLALDVLTKDFATIRTGKASPSLIENVVISAYGGAAKMKLNEVAMINVVDTQTLAVTPFDQAVIGEIQKGITEANLGVTPIIDAGIVRVTLPQLNEERRKEYVKLANQKAESGKVMMRQSRHESMGSIEHLEGTVSEDETDRLKKEVQKLTDEFIEKIDSMRNEKEKELMTL